MKSRKRDIELLEVYIMGTLGEGDRIALEERIKTDADLHSDYQELVKIRQGIRLKALQQKMKLLNDVEAGIDKPKENGSRNGSSWRGVMAALIILAGILFLSIYFLRQDQTKDLTIALNDDEFYRYVLHRTERNSHIESDTQKTEAYNLFTIREFSKARQALSAMWNEKQDTLSYFYLGITELSLGNRERACAIFHASELENYPIEKLIRFCE